MEFVILSLAALLTSLLTFFSGFGLGTILMPVFAVFFPVEIAIAITGVVHFLNNIFKLFLVGSHADKQVLINFGVTAFVAALVGGYLLSNLTHLDHLYTYTMFGREYTITPLKLLIAVLLIFFSMMELIPFMKKLKFDKSLLPIGGLLSGFFGGLSGHQGALRSAFLVKAGLSKDGFVATGIVIACIIDLSRLSIYIPWFSQSSIVKQNLTLIATATLSAFAGAFAGSKLLKKVTMESVQMIVTVMLVVLSICMALGIV